MLADADERNMRVGAIRASLSLGATRRRPRRARTSRSHARLRHRPGSEDLLRVGATRARSASKGGTYVGLIKYAEIVDLDEYGPAWVHLLPPECSSRHVPEENELHRGMHRRTERKACTAGALGAGAALGSDSVTPARVRARTLKGPLHSFLGTGEAGSAVRAQGVLGLVAFGLARAAFAYPRRRRPPTALRTYATRVLHRRKTIESPIRYNVHATPSAAATLQRDRGRSMIRDETSVAVERVRVQQSRAEHRRRPRSGLPRRRPPPSGSRSSSSCAVDDRPRRRSSDEAIRARPAARSRLELARSASRPRRSPSLCAGFAAAPALRADVVGGCQA